MGNFLNVMARMDCTCEGRETLSGSFTWRDMLSVKCYPPPSFETPPFTRLSLNQIFVALYSNSLENENNLKIAQKHVTFVCLTFQNYQNTARTGHCSTSLMCTVQTVRLSCARCSLHRISAAHETCGHIHDSDCHHGSADKVGY